MPARRAPWLAAAPQRPTLHAWDADDGRDRLTVLEDDVAALIRELAAARGELVDRASQDQSALARHLLSLVEACDGFERVFAHMRARETEMTPAMRAWAANFRTIQRMITRALDEQGVTPIETPTRQFDPHWHTAAGTLADASLPPGTIVEELKRGYVWRRQPLRKTEVVVVGEDGGG